MAEVAPWLRAADPAGEFVRGLQAGSSIALEKQRLAAESERTAADMEARRIVDTRERELNAARMQTEAAYRQQQIDLRSRALDQAAQLNQVRTATAAAKLQQQQRFNRVLQLTGDPQAALFQSGGMTPADAVRFQKDKAAQEARDFSNQIRAREVGIQEQREKRLADRPVPPRLSQKIEERLPSGKLQTTYQYDTPTATPGSVPYKEGDRIRNKKTGKYAIVTNGVPVEESDWPPTEAGAGAQ